MKLLISDKDVSGMSFNNKSETQQGMQMGI